MAVRGLAPERPRALLLDALGTLVELEPPAPALRRLLAERFAIEVTDEQASAAIGAEIAYYRAHLHEGRDAPSVAALRARCAEVLRAALPASPALAAIAAEPMTSLLLDSLRFRAFPDAPPALVAERRCGVRVVVVSNWDASLPDVLARIGLAELLDGVVSSAAAGSAKPAPGIFRSALALARVAAPAALHIGDSLREDVEGARAAGIDAVLLARGRSPAPALVPTIDSLAAVPRLLDGRL